VADVSGYATSYLVSAGIQVLALPFVLLARREKAASDSMEADVDDDVDDDEETDDLAASP
jgi:hypothetical protein